MLILVLTVLAGTAPARETPPKPLLDVADPAAASRLTPSSQQVRVARGAAPGVAVTVEPGPDPYPGVKVVPQDVPFWDLSPYGHVEARITNTGTEPLRFNLRVGNRPTEAQPGPWNTEIVDISPGQSVEVKVIFGFAFGYHPAYALSPEVVSDVLLFVFPSDMPQSFYIESLAAGGPPGEQPERADNRVKPPDGRLFDRGVAMDANRQLETYGGVSASVEEDGLVVLYPARSSNGLVKVMPAGGLWHLGDATEVRVAIRNRGPGPVTPAVKLASGRDGVEAAGTALAPDAALELVVPFAPSVPWQGVPAEQRKGGDDALPGTGTRYASDKTDAIYISAKCDSAASLRIDSIVAQSPAAELPDWLGGRPPVKGDWVQTFADEFNGSTVSRARWNNEGPNYWDKVSHWSKDNVIPANGLVRLRYERKVGFHNDDPTQKRTDWTSGYLDTFGKFRQRYGYFEARMKLPTAPGLWPAFWMMPDRGPAAGDPPGSNARRCTTSDGGMEFDIMEHLTVWGPHRYNMAMHWDDYGPDHKQMGTGKVYVRHDGEGYITAGLLWLPGKAVFFCNGREVGRWEDPCVSNVPGYMMFTLPAGGWDGNVLDGRGLPDDFIVDYVRVWQRRDLMAPK